MLQLDDLSMSRKLLILVVVGIIAILLVGSVGIYSTERINSQLNQLYLNKYAHSMLALEANSDMMSFAIGGYAATLENDRAKKVVIRDAQQYPYAALCKDKIARYEAIPMSPQEKAILDDLKQGTSEYFETAIKVDELDAAGNADESSKLRNGVMVPLRAKINTGLKQLIELNNQTSHQYYIDSNASYTTILVTTIIITIICAAILLIISWLIIRNLTRRFALLLKGMSEVGSGDLTYRIDMPGKDEISHVGSSFDLMTVNLERQTDEIMQNLEKSKRTNAAILETANEVKEGNLNVMIDSGTYDGEFLVMVRGINDLIEAFVRPLKEAMRIVNEYASGNFSARYDTDARVSGEFADLKDALNNSGTCVSEAITIIMQQIDKLTENAEEANASIEEVSASTKEISDSSVAVSTNTEKSNDGVQQVLRAMEDLNTTVNEVALRSEQVNRLTTEADVLSKDGATLAGVADQGMEGITRSTEESRSIIGDIRHQMEEIGTIIAIIKDISDQTGLLALNAAIEAARAGDAGLGFAVVADEVKSLALETQKSAENIANIIENLQKKTKMAVDSMEKTSVEVDTGGKALNDTLTIFTRIVDLITSINQNMGEVAAATEEQAASVEEITASIHEVGTLVKDTATEADRSAQATTDVAQAIDQITDVMNNLNGIVEQVDNRVKFFKI